MSKPSRSLQPALFLDRDGVINEEVSYLFRAENCVLVPGIASLILTAARLGYFVCVVTNQAGIGRGLFTEADFHALMAHIQIELARDGAQIDAIYFSPYHPVHGVGEYQRESHYRKPAPGMLLRAAEEHGLDLPRSVLVGDRCSDLQAGQAAGLQRLFLFGTTEDKPCPVDFPYERAQALCSVEQALIAASPVKTVAMSEQRLS